MTTMTLDEARRAAVPIVRTALKQGKWVLLKALDRLFPPDLVEIWARHHEELLSWLTPHFREPRARRGLTNEACGYLLRVEGGYGVWPTLSRGRVSAPARAAG
jgi:hypothetical protein